VADDLVEHEVTPGFEPTKEGVKDFFRTFTAAFPDMHMEVQGIVVSDDKGRRASEGHRDARGF
jgi:hypothetical protein